ncbi:MAG: PKD domain-containing protein [Bacteroidia bacterium]|jgi:PKD repeat protein|nr:PKD domain-containing protein [Bacteroidia bacterium]
MKSKSLRRLFKLVIGTAMTVLPITSVAQVINVSPIGSPCVDPPLCIVNGDLGSIATGDMNSNAATTVNGWYVSHGDPTIFGNDAPTGSNSRSVWMWSYLHSSGTQRGEGVYTCYNFQEHQQYTVCLWVRNTNGVSDGNLRVVAASGLTNIGPTSWSPIANPASQQLISSAFSHSATWVQLTYTFTPSQNFTQLWIYPFKPTQPVNGQQYELQIDDIRVTPGAAGATPGISASQSVINWCGSSTLSVSNVPPGATVTWAPAIGLSSTTGATVTASPCATTTYTATITPGIGSGCPTCGMTTPMSLTQQVLVVPPAVGITGNTSVQCGGTLNLTAVPSLNCGAVTYSWTGPGGFTATGQSISIPNVNSARAGTYNLVVSNANGGCQVPISVNVTITNCPLCELPPNCIQNGTLASNGTGDLNSPVVVSGWNVSHGSPTVFGNDAPTNTTNSSIWMWSYSGAGEGTYTCYNFEEHKQYTVCFWVRNTNSIANGGQLFVRAVNGFSNIGPTSTTVPNPASVQTIGTNPGNNQTWQQITYTFTANANYTQLWFYPLMLNGPVNNQQYELQIDDIRVTPALNPASLSISASPTAITWCGSSTLSVAGVPPGSTVTWAPALGLSSTTGATVTASPCASTTYTATVTPPVLANCPACTNAGPVTLTQQVLVIPPAIGITGTTTLDCKDTLNLTAVPSLNCSAVSYDWTGPNGFIAHGQSISIAGVTELNAGVYTLTVSNANGGCIETISVNVIIAKCPCEAKPEFKTDGCNPVSFEGGNNSTSQVISWFWEFGDGNTSTLQNPVNFYAAAGSYEVCLTIVAKNSDGEICCERVCNKIEVCGPPKCGIVARILTSPDKAKPLTVNFTDASATVVGGSVCWYEINYGDGSPAYAGSSLPSSYTYATAGSYEVCYEVTVCIYDANGNVSERCTDKYCEKVEVSGSKKSSARMGQSTETEETGSIKVFPNPANNNLFINIENMEQATVQIFNVNGQEMSAPTLTAKNVWQADVSAYSPGIYVVVVRDSNGKVERNVFVKE